MFNAPEKKTKTQGQNSSQNSRKKLKLSEALPSNFKNSRKNQLFLKKLWKMILDRQQNLAISPLSACTVPAFNQRCYKERQVDS